MSCIVHAFSLTGESGYSTGIKMGISTGQAPAYDTNSNNIEEYININSLPPSLLIHIFQRLCKYDLLCRASLVCTYWHQLSQDPDLWRSIIIYGQRKITDDILLRLVSLSNAVVELDICYLDLITYEGLVEALTTCPLLQKLKMRGRGHILNSGLKVIGEICSRLIQVDLAGSVSLQDEGLISICSGCANLTSIDLSYCERVTDAGITAITAGRSNLRTLDLVGCKMLTGRCISSIVDHCPVLKILRIFQWDVFTDNGARHLSRLRHLENLVLPCRNVSAESIILIVKSCHNLQVLKLYNAKAVDDKCMEHIAFDLPQLKQLVAMQAIITDQAMSSLATSSKHLKTISLIRCYGVTDHGIDILSVGSSSLQIISMLSCKNVTDKAVEKFRDIYPQIHYKF